MENTLVSFETAKLAKKKGFDINLNNKVYVNDKPILREFPLALNITVSTFAFACEQSLLQKWLREKHGIHIQIFIETYSYGMQINMQVLHLETVDEKLRSSDKSTGWYGDNGEYKTYEEALEAGLLIGLKLIG